VPDVPASATSFCNKEVMHVDKTVIVRQPQRDGCRETGAGAFFAVLYLAQIGVVFWLASHWYSYFDWP